MALDKRNKTKIDKTKSAKGPSPLLVSDLPPELTKDEALTPGALKLLIKEREQNDKKIENLEKKYQHLLEEKIAIKRENDVLRTKLSYSIIWDTLIMMAGISGGGIIATWNNHKEIPIFLGILTILLFALAAIGRKK